jgi:hypothetical protein
MKQPACLPEIQRFRAGSGSENRREFRDLHAGSVAPFPMQVRPARPGTIPGFFRNGRKECAIDGFVFL